MKNESIITARNTSIRRNTLSTIAFSVLKEGNRLSTYIFNARKATNLTSAYVVLTSPSYLKLFIRKDKQFQAANLTSTHAVLTFPSYLKAKTCVVRQFQAFHAPFTGIARIIVSNFAKQTI